LTFPTLVEKVLQLHDHIAHHLVVGEELKTVHMLLAKPTSAIEFYIAVCGATGDEAFRGFRFLHHCLLGKYVIGR
jgi:hypothetical protein